MTVEITEIQTEINNGDLSFEDIATLFETTVRQVDLVFLDMINAYRKQDEPAFYL